MLFSNVIQDGAWYMHSYLLSHFWPGGRASFVPVAAQGRASRGREEWMLTREGKPSLDRRVECEQLAGPERVTAASLMRAAQDEVARLPPKPPPHATFPDTLPAASGGTSQTRRRPLPL